MKKLSTGDNSTLGNWRKLVKSAFGKGPALEFIDRKISEVEAGEAEEVIADEGQFLYLLGNMQHTGGEGNV